jgi:hypothetical protein
VPSVDRDLGERFVATYDARAHDERGSNTFGSTFEPAQLRARSRPEMLGM